MISDCLSLRAGTHFETDICIVGAGAAGLALASRLAGSRHRICLIESGGLGFERARQRFSRGVSVGVPYESLDLCRVRQFGGSTGRAGWGGWCKMLDRSDFEERPWLPLSGWPIDQRSLLPHYEAAAGLLGIGDLLAESPADHALPADGVLLSDRCHLSPAPDLGLTLRPRLNEAPNVHVLLHATALTLHTDPAGRRVQSIEVAGKPATRFRVGARFFVLACGGIENARLLLASDRHSPNGLGNQHDQVGRYFMEHPRVRWGNLELREPDDTIVLHEPSLRLSGARRLLAGEQRSADAFGLALRPEIRATERLLNSRTWIRSGACISQTDSGEALQYLTFWLRKGRLHRDLLKSARKVVAHPRGATSAGLARLRKSRRPSRQFHFDTILEQEPDPASRVTLDNRCDEFGIRRVKLEWTVSPMVRRTLERVQSIIAEEMRLLGHCCQIHPDKNADAVVEPSYGWVRHHMGTTRMSNDPRTGVVDSSCRVYGLANLYIAGSSVFPTGGNDMPTLTIVALAIRLGQHLQQMLD